MAVTRGTDVMGTHTRSIKIDKECCKRILGRDDIAEFPWFIKNCKKHRQLSLDDGIKNNYRGNKNNRRGQNQQQHLNQQQQQNQQNQQYQFAPAVTLPPGVAPPGMPPVLPQIQAPSGQSFTFGRQAVPTTASSASAQVTTQNQAS